MDWQIRIAIIVAGIILVGYVVYDFKKKKKQREENERLKQHFNQDLDQLDSGGFDFTGVGSVRLAPLTDPEIINDEQHVEPIIHQQKNERDNQPKSIYHPQSQQADEIEQSEISEQSSSKSSQKIEDDIQCPLSEEVQTNQPRAQQQPKLVLSFLLQAAQGHQFHGKDFLPIFLSQGLRHGDMRIFHRYTKSGRKTGPVLFSLANGIAPGTFEISTIERFSTPALALFMTLPGPDDAQVAYNAMFNTIKLLKKELGGEILDESKHIYSSKIHSERLDQIQSYLKQFE